MAKKRRAGSAGRAGRAGLPTVARSAKVGRAGRARLALSHVDSRGRIKMVDVGAKAVTAREAVAHGTITMSREALRLIRTGRVKKGDPLQTARLAGILAAKQTSALIPLCHPLPLTGVDIELTARPRGYDIEARVRTTAQTGVGMEGRPAGARRALAEQQMVQRH